MSFYKQKKAKEKLSDTKKFYETMIYPPASFYTMNSWEVHVIKVYARSHQT